MERVVITGLGCITPLGLSVEEFWHNLTNGVSAVGPITGFDASDLLVQIGAEKGRSNSLRAGLVRLAPSSSL